jgi:hypothetical protein
VGAEADARGAPHLGADGADGEATAEQDRRREDHREEDEDAGAPGEGAGSHHEGRGFDGRAA